MNPGGLTEPRCHEAHALSTAGEATHTSPPCLGHARARPRGAPCGARSARRAHAAWTPAFACANRLGRAPLPIRTSGRIRMRPSWIETARIYARPEECG